MLGFSISNFLDWSVLRVLALALALAFSLSSWSDLISPLSKASVYLRDIMLLGFFMAMAFWATIVWSTPFRPLQKGKKDNMPEAAVNLAWLSSI